MINAHRRLLRAALTLLALPLLGCGHDEYGCPIMMGESDPQCRRRAIYTEECRDSATLVATTAGSPNSAQCTNQRHHMRVEPVTRAGEEIAALVFCECNREVKP